MAQPTDFVYKMLQGFLITAFLAFPLQSSARDADLPTEVIGEIDLAAYAKPPNLYEIVQIAVRNRHHAAEIAALYAEKTGARGEEAGLVAATIASELMSDAQTACAIAVAVSDASQASGREKAIICSKVAKSVLPRSADAAETTDYVDCLATRMGVGRDEGWRLAGLGSVIPAVIPFAIQAPAGLRSIEDAVVGEAAVNSASALQDDGAASSDDVQDAVMSGSSGVDPEQLDEFDSGRKKRKRRTSRSE